MAQLAFPIYQNQHSHQLPQTGVVFSEDEIGNSLMQDKGVAYNYILNKQYNRRFENGSTFYMKRKLDEYTSLLEKEVLFSSSASDTLNNEYFKKIVKFGPEIIPLILQELKYKNNYLVWAMNLITGRKISDGKITMSEAAKLWVSWGISNKII